MDLKELLGEEMYNQVIAKLGDKKIAVVSDGTWIPKDKFDSLNTEKKDLVAQLADRDKQLGTLTEAANGNEALQAQIKALQDGNEKQAKELNDKLAAQALDHAIEKAIGGAKGKNVTAVKALLKRDAIKMDGETLLGLEDQLKALKTSDPYLFDEAGGSGGTNPAGAAGGQTTKNPWSKEHFNLTEQGKIITSNPTLAAALMAAAKK